MMNTTPIWKIPFTAEQANAAVKGNLAEHMGIVVTDIGPDFVVATMPVDHRSKQPMGILHGGASVALAETIGSFAAQMAVEPGCYCVGLDINANHIRGVSQGIVRAVAMPLHLGRSTQVLEIKISNEQQQLVCISRLTMSVLNRN